MASDGQRGGDLHLAGSLAFTTKMSLEMAVAVHRVAAGEHEAGALVLAYVGVVEFLLVDGACSRCPGSSDWPDRSGQTTRGPDRPSRQPILPPFSSGLGRNSGMRAPIHEVRLPARGFCR